MVSSTTSIFCRAHIAFSQYVAAVEFRLCLANDLGLSTGNSYLISPHKSQVIGPQFELLERPCPENPACQKTLLQVSIQLNSKEARSEPHSTPNLFEGIETNRECPVLPARKVLADWDGLLELVCPGC